MTEETKLALINFTDLVSRAIAGQANGKDVDWREIIVAQETLQTALQSELTDPPSPKIVLGHPRHEGSIREVHPPGSKIITS